MEITLNSSVDVRVDIKALGISSCDRITYCSASFVKTDFSYCENKCFGKCIADNSYLEQSSQQCIHEKECCSEHICKNRSCLETDSYNIVYEENSHYIVISIPNNVKVGSYNLLLNVHLTNPQTIITKTYENIVTYITGQPSDKKFTIRIKSKYDDGTIIYSKQIYDLNINKYQDTINQQTLQDLEECRQNITNTSNKILQVNEDIITITQTVNNINDALSSVQNEQSSIKNDIKRISEQCQNTSSKFPIQTENISSDSITYEKLSQEVRKKIEDAYNSGGSGGVIETTKHVVMSYNEYIKIKYPDPNTVYFIYDNDTPIIPDPKPTANVVIKNNTIVNSGNIIDCILNTQAELQNYILKWQQ